MVLKPFQNLGTPVTLFWKKRSFMDWQDYHAYVSQIDELLWRNDVRERNVDRL